MEAKFLGEISFKEGYSLQKKLLLQRINNQIDDIILGLRHSPCITVGRAGGRDEIKQNEDIPVYFIERGGKVTYHGEGQLVCYFIWDIKNFGLRGFLDFLENLIASTLEELGIDKDEIKKNLKGRGIWVKDKKIASIGIGVKKWISFHGISINLDRRIHSGFSKIIPCGLPSAEVCCLEHFGIRASIFKVFKILVNNSCKMRYAGLKTFA